MDHSNYLFLSWFSPMTGGFDPRGGANHCLGGRKKKHPSSKYYKSTTQQIFTQTKLLIWSCDHNGTRIHLNRSYSVAVSTSDFELGDPNSNLGRTFVVGSDVKWHHPHNPPWSNGSDTWFSPTRSGFNSLWGSKSSYSNYYDFALSAPDIFVFVGSIPTASTKDAYPSGQRRVTSQK